MRKAPGVCAAFASMLLPLIPLFYLYNRNAEYISGAQVLVVGAAMALISLVGYLLFRWISKSSLAGVLSCLGAWVAFYAQSALYDAVVENGRLLRVKAWILVCAAAALVLIVLMIVIFRKKQSPAFCVMALVFTGVLFVMNGIPAVTNALAARQATDVAPIKTEYTVSQDSPSPNVYWLHLDGMLGFEVFERYYGDDQAEFKAALTARGFTLNEDALLESNHTTKIAVPSLMCPSYYDEILAPLLVDHETALQKGNYDYVDKNQLQYARLKNETRTAFEQKGYTTQNIGGLNVYYPPVCQRQYVTGDSRGGYLLGVDEAFTSRYLEVIEAGELSNLLTKLPSPTFFNLVARLSARGLTPFAFTRTPLTNTGDFAEIPVPREKFMLQAVADAAGAPGPHFTFIFDLAAHHPFTHNADGSLHGGDPTDIRNYEAQHRYACKVLLLAVDAILEKDPDAVIVLQADHGLHGQSRTQIEAAFGAGAEIPIWNQVMSGLRVPEAYRTDDLAYAIADPRNISRYLVNTFVGGNYEYIG